MVCWAIKFVTDQRQLPHTAILAAYWDNALPWLEQNYKMDLSYLEVRPSCRRYIYIRSPTLVTLPLDTSATTRQPAIQKIKTESFQTLTGCNPVLVAALLNPYNGTQLQTAGWCPFFPQHFHSHE